MQTQALDKYNPGEVNLLVPTTHLQQVSPWHVARVSEVRANPDPNAGDVFKVGSRWNEQKKANEDLFSPAKPLLMKIAAAAGIVWNWRESGPVALQRDYVCYKAVGAVRLPDGSWQPIMAEKEIDLTVIEEETYEANLKKALEYASDAKKQSYLKGMTPEQWAQAQTKANMIQWRKNKLMRAETGAMLRVIRAALGMKSQYTREELEKPFIVPRIDFSPDYSDPQVRQALIEHGVKAMASLFGQSSPAMALGAPAPFAERPAITGPVDDSLDVPFDSEEVAHPEAVQQIQEEQQTQEETSKENEAATTKPAESPAVESREPNLFSNHKPICGACGKEIQTNVATYSQQKFGQALCYSCQRKVGAKGA